MANNNQLTLNDQIATSIDLVRPLFGYKTVIYLPFTIVKQSDGHYAIRDESSSYDVRMCDCIFELDSTEYTNLIGALDGTVGSFRGNNSILLDLTNPNATGFHPFGPDKGDSGTFTVSMELISANGIGNRPYKYFHAHVRFVNQGSYPAYSIPSEISEGNWNFGTVQNVRFPPDWFEPSVNLGIDTSYSRDGSADFVDRGTLADAYNTSFTMECNESKAAKIIEYITATARGNSFQITTGENYYAFEYRKGSNATYNVKLVQNTITIENSLYNLFKFGLTLNHISTV